MYIFERLQPSSLHHLVALYKNAFDLNVSIEFLKMKYNTSSFGAAYIGYLAIAENGEAAAYYGVFPLVCDYSGEYILCAQSGDTMTHSKHRGKGLFVKLAQKTYQLAAKEGVKFIFGFPNENSYPGFVNKLNWIHEKDLNLYSIKVATLPLAKMAKKFEWFNFFYKGYVRFVLLFLKKKPTGFVNSLSGYTSACILHDSTFFEYKKYFSSFFYNINGKLVWFKIDGRLWLGDIENINEKEFYSVIKSLKRIAFFAGTTEIHFHTSPETAYNNYIANVGTLKHKNPIGFLDLGSGLSISRVTFQSGDFDTF